MANVKPSFRLLLVLSTMDVTYIVLLKLATTFPLIEDSNILKVANIFPWQNRSKLRNKIKLGSKELSRWVCSSTRISTFASLKRKKKLEKKFDAIYGNL
jgi:hypothetical protein